MPSDIEWHFIGTIQSNKIKQLLQVPNIYVIETIDTVEHAKAIEAELVRHHPGRTLRAFLQVNTSGEASKHGFSPDTAMAQFQTIKSICPHIELCGLMTIGSVEESRHSDGRNKDFALISEMKGTIEAVSNQPLQLSMGMSGDFEEAV